jgi:hypothetical protein
MEASRNRDGREAWILAEDTEGLAQAPPEGSHGHHSRIRAFESHTTITPSGERFQDARCVLSLAEEWLT